jgi:gamma-glutamylcyclotransferase (GGCT)/AIG2-like uncharacterized protein YtfP
MLYLAYGANTNRRVMATRCPNAVYLGKHALSGYKLVLKDYADAEPCEDSVLHCALWEITEECEKALDLYEDLEYYNKQYVDVNGLQALIYTMSVGYIDGDYPPLEYLLTIAEGYRDTGIDINQLDEAVLTASSRYKNSAALLS